MSTGPRIPHATAYEAAAWLCRLWKLGEPEDAIVGSVRRKQADVGDLELIAPLPAPQEPDRLYAAIAACVTRPKGKDQDKGALFAPTPPAQSNAIGEAVLGLKEGFKLCRLLIRGKSGTEMQVEINRYMGGRDGNRGWVQFVRTGPREWGKDCLTHWKSLNRISAESEGSRDFFLVDNRGNPQPTPTELHVFNLLRLLWVAPEQRRPETMLCVDWGLSSATWDKERLGKACVALGINPDDVSREFNEQRVAASAGKG